MSISSISNLDIEVLKERLGQLGIANMTLLSSIPVDRILAIRSAHIESLLHDGENVVVCDDYIRFFNHRSEDEEAYLVKDEEQEDPNFVYLNRLELMNLICAQFHWTPTLLLNRLERRAPALERLAAQAD